AQPDKDYLVYVLSEAADKISLVRFGPKGARVEREIVTGEMPVDLDGPHGIALSPDRQFYYVSIAHGRPFGSVWKYSTKDNSLIGKTTLGLFPATLDVTPDGNFLFVVNFNLHGDTRFAFQCAGHETLFRVHDGRHARRDRHAFVEGGAAFHRDEKQGAGIDWTTGHSFDPLDARRGTRRRASEAG